MVEAVAVVEELTVKHGQVVALNSVSCVLAVGVTGVLGPNGAGKSTLFRVLVGLQRFSAGRVRTRGTVGYLPQDMRLYKGFTAAEVLRYVGWVRGLPQARARSEAVRCLDLMGMASCSDSRVRALSGGMQQRLVIASAFVGDPDLIVLDEPTVGLDMEQQVFFRDLIRAEGARRAVVISSHIATDIVRTCSSVLVLDRGRLVHAGSVDSLGAGDSSVAGQSRGPAIDGRSSDDVGRFEDAYLRLLGHGSR